MKKTIFLIEDEPQIIEVYEIVLKKAGFATESIIFGKNAIERFGLIQAGKATKPDLVLLDLVLPDINGMEVLKEIRNYEKTKDIPVFILTNYTSKELEKMGYNLESEKFLLKAEYTPSQLLQLVKERLGGA